MATSSITLSWDDSKDSHILDATGYNATYDIGGPNEVPVEERLSNKQYIGNRMKGHILAEVLNWDESEASGPLSQEPGYEPDYGMFTVTVN